MTRINKSMFRLTLKLESVEIGIKKLISNMGMIIKQANRNSVFNVKP